MVKKSLALYGKNGIIADGTDEKRLVRFEQTELPDYFACGPEIRLLKSASICLLKRAHCCARSYKKRT